MLPVLSSAVGWCCAPTSQIPAVAPSATSGNHTWCELCLDAGGQRSVATQQLYWPGAPDGGERELVDLCQEWAEHVEYMFAQHGLDGSGMANPPGSERHQRPAEEHSRGGRRHPSTLTDRRPLVHYRTAEMTVSLCDRRKLAAVTDSEAEVTCERCMAILRFPIFRYSPGREKYPHKDRR